MRGSAGSPREHGDVEFWVERLDAGRSKAVLVEAGATALATQPPEEACEFTWGGADFSTAYFDRQPGGSFIQLQGRWSDWVFPPGSFGDEPGMLDGAPVLTMSVAGMLAMKEQYPRLRNGGPWRQKDIDDIKVLRRLAAEAGAQPLAQPSRQTLCRRTAGRPGALGGPPAGLLDGVERGELRVGVGLGDQHGGRAVAAAEVGDPGACGELGLGAVQRSLDTRLAA